MGQRADFKASDGPSPTTGRWLGLQAARVCWMSKYTRPNSSLLEVNIRISALILGYTKFSLANLLSYKMQIESDPMEVQVYKGFNIGRA